MKKGSSAKRCGKSFLAAGKMGIQLHVLRRQQLRALSEGVQIPVPGLRHAVPVYLFLKQG